MTEHRTAREIAFERALRQFADPSNWSDEPGRLQWIGKRHAVDFARTVLDDIDWSFAKGASVSNNGE